MNATCELNENGSRIEVFFSYHAQVVAAVKTIPGRSFVPARGARRPHWTVPANMESARQLRAIFGKGLTLGPQVQAWGREQNQVDRNLGALKAAGDATLTNVPAAAADWLRPYQRADVALMSVANLINGNQPGVGKTVEVIYAVKEAQLKGPHLVICPISLFKDPWRDELAKHAPEARVIWGSTPAERRGAINFVWSEWLDGKADDIWLLLNPDQIRAKKVDQDASIPLGEFNKPLKVLSSDHKGNRYVAADSTGERLSEIKWGALVCDEFPKFGLGADRNTLFARGIRALRANAARAWACSGTPMGGKAIRLWGVLNFLEPETFSSKWTWAENWLEIDDNGYGKKIGSLRADRKEAFDAFHSRYLIRRLRSDALPGLPPKVVIDKWVPMTLKQRKTYNDFNRDLEAAVEGGRVMANGVLAEYTRAKQFANALCKIEDGVVRPTPESGKLPVLLEELDSYGVRKADFEPGARAIVASESKEMIEMVSAWLEAQGLRVRLLTGAVTGDARDAVIGWYKEEVDEARVLAMTTQTGGVGLNLGMTGSIHILDETWNPDDQEQLEDRGMRNRTTPLMVIYYRTEDSIQEYIYRVAQGKTVTNRLVLDAVRQGKEATH